MEMLLFEEEQSTRWPEKYLKPKRTKHWVEMLPVRRIPQAKNTLYTLYWDQEEKKKQAEKNTLDQLDLHKVT